MSSEAQRPGAGHGKTDTFSVTIQGNACVYVWVGGCACTCICLCGHMHMKMPVIYLCIFLNVCILMHMCVYVYAHCVRTCHKGAQ